QVEVRAAGTHAMWAWAAGTMHLGMSLPSGVNGEVAVEVVGFAAGSSTPIAHSSPWDMRVSVTPGEPTVIVALTLVAGPPPQSPDGGTGTGGIPTGAGGLPGGVGGLPGGVGGTAGAPAGTGG